MDRRRGKGTARSLTITYLLPLESIPPLSLLYEARDGGERRLVHWPELQTMGASEDPCASGPCE